MSARRAAASAVTLLIAQSISVRAGLPNALVPIVFAVVAVVAAVVYARRSRPASPASDPYARSAQAPTTGVRVAEPGLVSAMKETPERTVHIIVDTDPNLGEPLRPRRNAEQLQSDVAGVSLWRRRRHLFVCIEAATAGPATDRVLAIVKAQRENCQLAGVVARFARPDRGGEKFDRLLRSMEAAQLHTPVRPVLAAATAAETASMARRGFLGELAPTLEGLSYAGFAQTLASMSGADAVNEHVVADQRQILHLVARIEPMRQPSIDALELARSEHPSFSEGARSYILDFCIAPDANVDASSLENYFDACHEHLVPAGAHTRWLDRAESSRASLTRRYAPAALALASALTLLACAILALPSAVWIRERVARAEALRADDPAARAQRFAYFGDALLAGEGARHQPAGAAVALKLDRSLRVGFGEAFARYVVAPVVAARRATITHCAARSAPPAAECVEAVTFERDLFQTGSLRGDSGEGARRRLATALSAGWRDALFAGGFRAPPPAARWRASIAWLRVYGDALRAVMGRDAAPDEATIARAISAEGLLEAYVASAESGASAIHRDNLVRALAYGGNVFDASALPAAQYTESAWREEIAPRFARDADALARQPTITRALSIELGARDTMRALLVARYFLRYERAWREALGRLRLSRTTDERDTLAQIDALTNSTSSPYERLLCLVDRASRPSEIGGTSNGRWATLDPVREALWATEQGETRDVPPEVAARLREAFAPTVALAMLTRGKPPCDLADLHAEAGSRLREHLARVRDLRRESNAAQGISVELGSDRSSADSPTKQDDCEDRVGDANSVEIGRTCSACSNVASAVERALAALVDGRIDIARRALGDVLVALRDPA